MPAITATKKLDFLTDVAAVVVAFLKEHGGMSNGYDTWAEGRPSRGGYGPIAWRTPTSENLTGVQVREKERELKNSILAVMAEYNVERVEIITGCDTSGCYRTYVKWVDPEPPKVEASW